MNSIKSKYLLLLFLLSLTVNGQTSIDLTDFSNHTDRLINQKIIHTPESYSTTDFFIDKELKRYFNGKKRGATYSFKKDYAKIIGKELTILSIEDSGSIFGYSDVLGNRLLFSVQHPDLGVLYYNGYSKSNREFKLSIPLKLPPFNEIYCQEFIQRIDKFEGTESITTDYTDNISFTKVKDLKRNETVFYMRLDIASSIPQAFKKGVKIIFEDGELFDYPDEEIDYSVSNKKYRDYDVTAFMRMDDKLIKKVLSSRITDFRLYIDDGGRSEEGGRKTMGKFRCLIDNTYSVKK